MSGRGLSGTESEAPDSRLGNELRNIGRITKEFRVEWMKTPPESIMSSWCRRSMDARALRVILADGFGLLKELRR
eukprot:13081048-Heterocapsa_arctica.AAC.1